MPREDIDTKTIEKLDAFCKQRFQHPQAFPEGGWIEPVDCTLRAKGHDGRCRFFLSSKPGDLSIDWLDITDYIDNFNIVSSGMTEQE